MSEIHRLPLMRDPAEMEEMIIIMETSEQKLSTKGRSHRSDLYDLLHRGTDLTVKCPSIHIATDIRSPTKKKHIWEIYVWSRVGLRK